MQCMGLVVDYFCWQGGGDFNPATKILLKSDWRTSWKAQLSSLYTIEKLKGTYVCVFICVYMYPCKKLIAKAPHKSLAKKPIRLPRIIIRRWISTH